jgi:hypothetical protein
VRALSFATRIAESPLGNRIGNGSLLPVAITEHIIVVLQPVVGIWPFLVS